MISPPKVENGALDACMHVSSVQDPNEDAADCFLIKAPCVRKVRKKRVVTNQSLMSSDCIPYIV